MDEGSGHCSSDHLLLLDFPDETQQYCGPALQVFGEYPECLVVVVQVEYWRIQQFDGLLVSLQGEMESVGWVVLASAGRENTQIDQSGMYILSVPQGL